MFRARRGVGGHIFRRDYEEGLPDIESPHSFPVCFIALSLVSGVVGLFLASFHVPSVELMSAANVECRALYC